MDDIKEYLVTVKSQIIYKFCSSCDTARYCWQAITMENEIITCCGTCQKVLERK